MNKARSGLGKSKKTRRFTAVELWSFNMVYRREPVFVVLDVTWAYEYYDHYPDLFNLIPIRDLIELLTRGYMYRSYLDAFWEHLDIMVNQCSEVSLDLSRVDDIFTVFQTHLDEYLNYHFKNFQSMDRYRFYRWLDPETLILVREGIYD
jgi:hypothetical protein